MKNKFLICIVGPTAIGKTTLSIKVANAFDTEIISCDSRQFFKEMNIGTAVPDVEEQAAAKHHFIHSHSIKEDYSVGKFETEAINTIDQLFKTHDVLVMVGGSGLYVDAVTKGLDHFPKVDPEIRKKLNAIYESEGIASLQKQLKELDPKSYNTIEVQNPHRIIRALEICIGTGKPFSSFKSNPNKKRNFTPIYIGLNAEREIIYNRINQRVDIMIDKGLLEEVEQLLPYKNLNALQTVGYRELFDYFEGNCSLEIAVEEIKKNTRRFAKRQLTWFKKNEQTIWFDYLTEPKTIIDSIKKVIS